MKGMISEFKEFIARGNVIDMAVGIIMGTAFTGIVNSLVNGLVMPIIGFVIQGINFTDLRIILSPAEGETPEVAILYGSFIQQVINFLIVAFVVFLMVKAINRFRKKKEAAAVEAPAPLSDEVLLLTEIRDLLSQNTKE